MKSPFKKKTETKVVKPVKTTEVITSVYHDTNAFPVNSPEWMKEQQEKRK